MSTTVFLKTNLFTFLDTIDIATLILILITTPLVILFIRWLFKPVNYVKDLSLDDGNDNPTPLSSSRLPTGDVPIAVYPNGWIPLIESRLLGKNQVKTVHIFGGDLIVFRGSSGQPFVLDAYCPHLGAHLGFGGRVYCRNGDDCLRCPFHGWSFRASDGQCVDIPYSEPVSGARVKTWKTVEMNGFVFVWYHGDDREPFWWPDEVTEISSGKWQYRGKNEHVVSCYLQEIPENGADLQHLNPVHKPMSFLGTDLDILPKFDFLLPVLNHRMFDASWTPLKSPNEHVALFKFKMSTRIFKLDVLTMNLTVYQVGPAYVNINFVMTPFGFPITGCYIHSITPIKPKKQKVIHQLYLENRFSIFGRLLSKLMISAQAKQVERDIFVWNRKAFLRNPMLTKEEKSLAKFRKWFSQFYSKDKLDW